MIRTALETRYRSALRWYPPVWRAANGDAMLGTLLERAADEERAHPAPGELTDLRIHGMRERAIAAVTVVPADGRRAARAAAVGLGAGFSLFFLVAYEFGPFDRPDPAEYGLPAFGAALSPGAIVYAVWLVAFVLAAFRWDRTARVALCAAALASTLLYPVTASAFSGHLSGPRAGETITVAFLPAPATLVFLGALAIVGAIGRAPLAARSVGLTSFGVTVVALVIIAVQDFARTGFRELSDSGLWRDERSLGVVIAALLVFAMILRRRTPRAASAYACVAGVLFAMLAGTLLVAKAGSPGVNALISFGGAAVVVALVAGGAILAHRRRLRRVRASGSPLDSADWEA
ncbi:hypothetical protein GCM10027406_09860 [Leifsonia lichenia]